jgi:hypothetical protein
VLGSRKSIFEIELKTSDFKKAQNSDMRTVDKDTPLSKIEISTVYFVDTVITTRLLILNTT